MLEPTTLTPGYFPQKKGGFTRPILNPRDRGWKFWIFTLQLLVCVLDGHIFHSSSGPNPSNHSLLRASLVQGVQSPLSFNLRCWQVLGKVIREAWESQRQKLSRNMGISGLFFISSPPLPSLPACNRYGCRFTPTSEFSVLFSPFQLSRIMIFSSCQSHLSVISIIRIADLTQMKEWTNLICFLHLFSVLRRSRKIKTWGARAVGLARWMWLFGQTELVTV